FRKLREYLADVGEDTRVRRRVRTWRTADRCLVDVDHLVEQLPADELVVGAGTLAAAVELLGERPVERVDDERALARSGHAGHAGDGPERDLDGDVPEVVLARAAHGQVPARATAPCGRRRNRDAAGEVAPGERRLVPHDLRRRADGDDAAPVPPR